MTTTAKQVIHEEGSVPIKIWTDDIEEDALTQLKNDETDPSTFIKIATWMEQNLKGKQ